VKNLSEYDGEPQPHIINAIIEDATIRFDRDIFLSCWLTLNYGGTGQGFGGYVLGGTPRHTGTFPAGDHANQPNVAGHYIANVMAVVGVTEFDHLRNKVIRVVQSSKGYGSNILGIGHPIEDKWFFPNQELDELQDSKHKEETQS
jgi:hypothetical protein